MTQAASQLLLLRHSRANETEADEVALRLLREAGIAAGPFANFFDTINKIDEEKKGKAQGYRLPDVFQTHPPPPERARGVRASSRLTRQRLPSTTRTGGRCSGFAVKCEERLIEQERRRVELRNCATRPAPVPKEQTLIDHLTTSTGTVECVRTFCVSLPRIIPVTPRRPCEAMTMRSQPLALAVSTMADQG